MHRAIRRTLSALAVLALAAGSALIAAPAHADPDTHIAITSPAAGQTIYSCCSYNQVYVNGSTGADTQWATISVDRRIEAYLPSGDFSVPVWVMGFGDHEISLQAYGMDNLPVGPQTVSITTLEATAPTVTITSPTADSSHPNAGQLHVGIETTLGNTGGPITSWSILITNQADQTVYESGDNSSGPPASIDVNVAGWARGAYVITAVVNDSWSEQGRVSVPFRIVGTAPIVEISEPAIDAHVSGTFNLRASIYDLDGDLRSYGADLYGVADDGVSCESISLEHYDADLGNGAPASIVTTTRPNGVYCIGVQATDNEGNTTTSTRLFTVDNPVPGVPSPQSPSGWPESVATLEWSSVAEAVGYEHSVRDASDNVITDGVSTSSEVDLSASITADGRYSWAVRAYDSAGNYSAWSAYLDFGIDSTDPVVGFHPQENTELNAAGPLTGTYNDGEFGSGIAVEGIKLTLQRDVDGVCRSTVGDPITATFSDGTWSASLAGIDYGRYCVTVTATDAVGNTGTALGHFWIDTIAPTVPIPQTPSGLVGKVDTLDWTDADDTSGEVSYIWELRKPSAGAPPASEGPVGPACAADDPSCPGAACPKGPAACAAPPAGPAAAHETDSHPVEIDPLVDEGDYSFRVRSVDAFGNLSEWSAYLDFTIDTTDPEVFFDLEDDAEIDVAGQVLSGTYSDGKKKGSLDGVASVELLVQLYDDGAEQCSFTVGSPITADMAEGIWSATLSDLDYGHYCISATATDAAGNAGTTVGRFWIDVVAPDAPEPLAPSGLVGTWAELYWDFVFDDGGVEYEFEVYDAAGMVGTPGHATASHAPFAAPLSSGEYHFRVRASDGFGNIGDWSAEQAFTMDAEAPRVSLVAPAADDSSTSSDVTFRWSSPDSDVGLYALQVSPTSDVDEFGQLTAGETWVLSHTSQLVTGLANGRYYWQVIAEDRAGNGGEWSELRVVDVAVPPATVAIKKALTETGDIVEPVESEPTETTAEPAPAPSTSDEPEESTDGGAAESPEAAAAADSSDDGFPFLWIIIGVGVLVLGGGAFFIRFLVMRA